MQHDLTLYCLKFLHRHPSEVNLTLEDMGDIAYVAEEMFEYEAALAGAKIG